MKHMILFAAMDFKCIYKWY